MDLVETPDPATAIVRLNQPAAYALYDLALIPMTPAEAANDFGDHPIGTGPYMFDGFDARPTGTWIVTRVFHDPRVRSAVSHLIPRDGIVESVLDGYGFATSTVLGAATPWSDAVAGTPYDPGRAQALLNEAGVRIDRPLTLLTNEGNRSREGIAEELEETFG